MLQEKVDMHVHLFTLPFNLEVVADFLLDNFTSVNICQTKVFINEFIFSVKVEPSFFGEFDDKIKKHFRIDYF